MSKIWRFERVVGLLGAISLTTCFSVHTTPISKNTTNGKGVVVVQKTYAERCFANGPTYYRYSDLGKRDAPVLSSQSNAIINQVADYNERTHLYFSLSRNALGGLGVSVAFEGGDTACTPSSYKNLLSACNMFYNPTEQPPDMILPGDLCDGTPEPWLTEEEDGRTQHP